LTRVKISLSTKRLYKLIIGTEENQVWDKGILVFTGGESRVLRLWHLTSALVLGFRKGKRNEEGAKVGVKRRRLLVIANAC